MKSFGIVTKVAIIALITVLAWGAVSFFLPTASKRNVFSGQSKVSALKNTHVSPEYRARMAQVGLLVQESRSAQSSGNLVLAETKVRQALALEPKDARSWSRLGKVLDALGRYQEAYVAFKTLLTAQDFGSSDRSNPEFLWRFAEICELTGHEAEANSHYRSVALADDLQGFGNGLAPRDALGRMPPKALARLARAIKRPRTQAHEGDSSGACQQLRALVHDYPSFYEAWYHLGQAELAVNSATYAENVFNCAAARGAFRQCADLAPEGSAQRELALEMWKLAKYQAGG